MVPRARHATAPLLMALLTTMALLPGVTMASAARRAEARVAPAVADAVRLVASTQTGLTFEVRVPWDEVSLEAVSADGREFVRVSLPGWATTSHAGAPALPFVSQAIGAPFGATLRLDVEPGREHRLSLGAPALPAATQTAEWGPPAETGAQPGGPSALPRPALVFKADPAVYSAPTPYPGPLAEVTGDGVLRQQRVAGIAVYPIQYDPQAREIAIYESLRVRVSFVGLEGGAGVGAADSPAYEEVLRQSLLNYDTARQWRQADVGAFVRSAEGVDGGSLPWAPPAPGWRVRVQEEGFYRLTYDELEGAGLDVEGLDPQTIQLYNLGGEVAIHVEGEGDGDFNEEDVIVFYGRPSASKYAATNVYWLTYGQATGLRMGSRVGTPVVDDTPAYYSRRLHREGSGYYVQKSPGDDALERWLWDYIYAPSRPSWTHTMSLAAPYAAPATLRVAMLGYVKNDINPDHHVVISLNGAQVDELWFDGITWRTVDMPIPGGLLATGTNTVTVTAVNDTGVGYDVIYIDWAELDFDSGFVAQADELSFNYDAIGTWTFDVDGFSTDQLAVHDVTDPAAVVRIEGASVVSSTLGYMARFQDSVAALTHYWAMADTTYRTVEAIDPQDAPSDLQSTANGADHIIITHAEFVTQALQLRDHRAAAGLRSMVVDVQNVYDEFAYGLDEPAAIHDFLAYAYANWEGYPPSFVALVGDGHYDPKNHAYTRVSYIHPYLAAIDPTIVETAADNRYVTFIGDDSLPDMMLGRLAVNNSGEAAAFVDKILGYEQTPAPGDWLEQVLLVADDKDTAGDFAQLSDDLVACCLPESYQAQTVYYGLSPYTATAAARTAIQDGINAGKLVVNYVGHGATTQWADEGLFKATDVAGLTNGAKLPVVLAMTCYDGFYHHPRAPEAGYEATAELVTRAEGIGAVASWSPTGLGVAVGHGFLDKAFFTAAFYDPDGRISLGEATTGGLLSLWATGDNLDMVDTYVLFGDPATMMTLPYGTAVDYVGFEATGACNRVELHWETASEGDNTGFNLYRATAFHGGRVKMNAELIPSEAGPGGASGAMYAYTDTDVAEGVTYYYWLENVDIDGHTGLRGPIKAEVACDWHTYLPAVSGSGSGPAPGPD